jgi:hypothetical protein
LRYRRQAVNDGIAAGILQNGSAVGQTEGQRPFLEIILRLINAADAGHAVDGSPAGFLDSDNSEIIPEIFDQSGFRKMEMFRQPLAGDIVVFQLRDDLFHGMGAQGEKGVRAGGLSVGLDRRPRRERRQ